MPFVDFYWFWTHPPTGIRSGTRRRIPTSRRQEGQVLPAGHLFRSGTPIQPRLRSLSRLCRSFPSGECRLTRISKWSTNQKCPTFKTRPKTPDQRGAVLASGTMEFGIRSLASHLQETKSVACARMLPVQRDRGLVQLIASQHWVASNRPSASIFASRCQHSLKVVACARSRGRMLKCPLW